MKKPKLADFAPETDSFLDEVLAGLAKKVKEIPSKFFYDERGSRLFEEITRLDDYYLTRTEVGILRENIADVVEHIGHGTMLIEYGSGTSDKTRILLDNLPDLAAYVPIDISKEHLIEAASEIAKSYPELEVLPVAADYNDSSFVIPQSSRPISHRVVFYPGSTIGNFHPDEARAFLGRIARVCGAGGGLLLGVDLKKDPSILHHAYNDSDGVTARFNLNLLRRMNRELGANFALDRFKHRAIYNQKMDRVEMHLVSLDRQTVQVSDTEFHFDTGETIWTESSYKYTTEGFAALCSEAGFDVAKVWMDDDRLFSVQYLATK